MQHINCGDSGVVENQTPQSCDNEQQLVSPAPIPLIAEPMSSPQPKQYETDESVPVKKKRGRPPLDDDFDSYSTPKISHVESTAGSINDHQTSNFADSMSDDNSREMQQKPTLMLEQNMEVLMDADDDDFSPPAHMIPKIERPETPPMDVNYYSYDDMDPQSPLDDPSDPSSSSQVKSNKINHYHCNIKFIDFIFFLKLGCSDRKRRSRMA